MKNLAIAAVIGLLIWAAISFFKTEKKPDNALIKYTEGLKSSEEKAAEAKDIANLAIIRSAISQFRGSEGRYPDSLQELVSKNFMDRVPQGINYDKETGTVE